jgi:hypothetical protein
MESALLCGYFEYFPIGQIEKFSNSKLLALTDSFCVSNK